MQCHCKHIEILENAPAYVYFIAAVAELRRKTEMLLGEMGFAVQGAHGMVRCRLESARDFIHDNHERFITAFNTMEREDIRVHFHACDQNLDIASLVGARSLQYYLNSIEDDCFFGIMQEESLTSYFQPIVDMHTGVIAAHEALARGVRMDGSLMYPEELFEKAHSNDLTFYLDRLARESALKTAAAKKLRTKLFINFIPTAIYDPAFCLKSTVNWARQLEFDPSQIVFEVVETERVADKEHLHRILTFYRDQGFKIALDDVGEGYSSLNMLIRLRPDFIKVDREIIMDIDKDPVKQSVYKGLFDTAATAGITLLAEGIETADELACIESIGVDYVQGYYFGRPSPEPLRSLQLPKPLRR